MFCRTRGRDGVAVLLSCRARPSPTTCRFIPAHPRFAEDPDVGSALLVGELAARTKATRKTIEPGILEKP